MTSIFVLVHNGGCEGFSPPLQAFTNLAEAQAAQKLFALRYESGIEIYEVPVWPLVGDDYPRPIAEVEKAKPKAPK